MKFFKMPDGTWINPTRVRYFFVEKNPKLADSYLVKADFYECHKAHGFEGGHIITIAEFTNDTREGTHYAPKAAAQNWLDRLIADINEDKTPVNVENIAEDFANKFIRLICRNANNQRRSKNRIGDIGDTPWLDFDRVDCTESLP